MRAPEAWRGAGRDPAAAGQLTPAEKAVATTFASEMAWAMGIEAVRRRQQFVKLDVTVNNARRRNYYDGEPIASPNELSSSARGRPDACSQPTTAGDRHLLVEAGPR
jgi:hypothetical protein